MSMLFRLSKTARSADTSRAFRRLASPSRELHNLNAGAIFFRGLVTFDPSVIRINWKRINQNPLTRAGMWVRAIARRSIRETKKSRSMPGQPPHSHQGRGGKRSARGGENRPFKMIYSVPNMTYTSVMVGMVGFRASRPVPGVHEHGLSITQEVRTTKARAQRRIVVHSKTRRGHDKYRTRYLARRPVQYPERPFMYPALKKAAPSFPSMWNYMKNPNMPQAMSPPDMPVMWRNTLSR